MQTSFPLEAFGLLGRETRQPQIAQIRPERRIYFIAEPGKDFGHVKIMPDQGFCHCDNWAISGVHGYDLTLDRRSRHLLMIDRDGEQVIRRAHPHAIALVDLDLAMGAELELIGVLPEQHDKHFDTPFARSLKDRACQCANQGSRW